MDGRVTFKGLQKWLGWGLVEFAIFQLVGPFTALAFGVFLLFNAYRYQARLLKWFVRAGVPSGPVAVGLFMVAVIVAVVEAVAPTAAPPTATLSPDSTKAVADEMERRRREAVTLYPGSGPPFATTGNDKRMAVRLGAEVVTTDLETITVLRMKGTDVLTLTRENGGILINAQVFSPEGQVVVLVERNEITTTQNALPIKRPDKHTLVVEDLYRNTVLSVRYIHPLVVRITGVFRPKGGGEPFVATDEMNTYGGLKTTGSVMDVFNRAIEVN
jgi:hypothetical protein